MGNCVSARATIVPPTAVAPSSVEQARWAVACLVLTQLGRSRFLLVCSVLETAVLGLAHAALIEGREHGPDVRANAEVLK